MARSRNIKPSFFDNDELADLNPLARLLFIGIWTLCDHRGNMEWRTKRVKKQLLAYDDCDIDKLAINLDKSGFVRFYSDGEKIYLNVVNFRKHQNPHKNERDKGSDIPDINNDMRQAIDLNGLAINRDKSGLNRDDDGTNPADSLNLIPDSLNLIPDKKDASASARLDRVPCEKIKQKKVAKAPVDFSVLGLPDDQVAEVKRIRKANKGGTITQRVANELGKQFKLALESGYSVDEILTEWEVRSWKSFKFEWMNPRRQGASLHDISKVRYGNGGDL